jgi:heme-degrading monooxygenase HmoA
MTAGETSVLLSGGVMLVILFRSKLTPEAGTDYQAMGDEMFRHAQGQPGFVDYKDYTNEDGERLTVVRWEDEKTLEQWRNDPKHRAAKSRGRERWYQHYHVEVAKVVHESKFDRSAVTGT